MDEARLEKAWREHSRAILRYCAFSTGSPQDAEDLTAETFSRLVRSGERVDPGKLEAWLFAVARNLCASFHRTRGRSRGLLATLVSRESRDETCDAWRDPDVWTHVRALDERSRLAVYLRVVEDRPFAEVATLMGASQSAAKMTYYRALERLRDSFAEENAEELASASAVVGGVGNAE